MKNFVQPGDVVTLTAPYAVSSGGGCLVDSVFGVATSDVAISVAGEFKTMGVFDIAKTSAQAWTQGQKIYWDNTNKRCDSDASVGPEIGYATEAAANPSATGRVRLNSGDSVPRSQSVQQSSPAPSSIATAGPETYTAAQILSGVIVRDPAGAARTDTLPTAALLVAAVKNAKVGDMVRVLIVNGADGIEAITLAAGAGGAFDANQTAASRVIPQNASKLVYVRLTNVTASAEAYVVYA